MRPPTLFTLLCAGAFLVGARMYVDHRFARTPKISGSSDPSTQAYISELESELDQLRNDNASLRSLISADAPLEIDPALIHFVENDLGAKFRTPPIVLLRSEDILREAAGQLWLGAFGEIGLEMRSYAYDVLGILPPNQNFIGQIIAAQTVGAVGVYDHSSGEVLLAQHFDKENTHHQAGLVRLLAVALLEQQNPLITNPSDDQFFSYLALHRGRASMLQDRFYSIQARNIGFIDDTQNTEALELFNSLTPYVRDISTFPNKFGKDYLAKLPNKEDINKALANDLITSQSILLARQVNAPKFISNDEDGVQLSTQLGALTVKSFLTPAMLKQTELTPLLSDYKSDKLSITTTDKGLAATIWEIDFTSEVVAHDFYSAAAKVLSAYESKAELSESQQSVTLTFSEQYQSE